LSGSWKGEKKRRDVLIPLRASKKKGEYKKEVKIMAIDPVCGMTVDENKAAAKHEYQGKTYYFCAVGCKEKFAQAPEKFVKQEKKG
jgi:YHS domain-containing protein